jgi:hypothetical protein
LGDLGHGQAQAHPQHAGHDAEQAGYLGDDREKFINSHDSTSISIEQ